MSGNFQYLPFALRLKWSGDKILCLVRFFLIFVLAVLAACLGASLPSSLYASAGDFAISSMGGNNTTALGATYPAVAYNSTDQEYLIVWEGDNTTDEEYEIWGQLIDAVTGLAIGTAFRISDMGPDGGDKGGHLVAEGTPREVAQIKASITGQYLKKAL